MKNDIMNILENRLFNLRVEKENTLLLLENNTTYEESYITHRLICINERIYELTNLKDDIQYLIYENGEENEKED